jgi:hypothetical protein
MLGRIVVGLACALAISAASAGPVASKKSAKASDKPAQCMTDEGGGRKRPCDAGSAGGAGGGM